MDQFEVVVSKAEALTPRIREFVLARANGAPMPGWAAGAHIDVHLPDVGRRSYSLIETNSPRTAAEHPTAYRIAVLQESKSRGGSTFMHGLKTGDRLTISPPANNFPLGAGTSEVALVAGGIGVTPLLAMACELSAAKRPFSFYYAGRSRSELAFLGDIERLANVSATIHADDPVDVAVGSGSVWVVNRRTRTVQRIDPATGRTVATIPLGNSPIAVAVGAGAVWVAVS